MTRPIGKLERLYLERHARDLALAARPGGHPKGYRFDADAAERPIQFIERYCRHHKGEWAGQPLILGEWQRGWIRVLFGWLRPDGSRRYRKAWVEVAKKNGKALDVETPIPTPAGWKRMGDLAVGDAVFDETGRPCRVVFATDVMFGRECYRVGFSDGSEIVADADHLWFTEARRTGLPRTGLGPKTTWRKRHIRTTLEIRDTLLVRGGSANHTVPCAGPLSCSRSEGLPVPPYTLGVWLGDGASSCARFTSTAADAKEISAAIRAEGVSVGAGVPDRRSRAVGYPLGTSPDRSNPSGSLQRKLRLAGLLGNKHIPDAYLWSGEDQRWALLRGLMDTDGTVSKAGQCVFSTTSPALRDGFVQLARSLGFKPTLDTDTAKLRGRAIGTHYRIQFWAFAGDPVFVLSRKANRLKPRPAKRPRSARRQIVAVDPVPSVPVRCIQVDSPNRLYLAGPGMVPTHNTEIAAALGLYLLIADNEPGAEVYTTATKKEQAAICHTAAREMVRASPELARFVRVPKAAHANLVCERLNSKMQILASDAGTTNGINPNGDLRDEVGDWQDERLAGALDTASAARRQPLTLEITTAGVYDPNGVGWLHHDYAVQVLEGALEDDRLFVFIAAIDEGDDWQDPAAWGKANPNLGISPKIEFLTEQIAEAAQNPAKQNDVLRYNLNRWTQQAQRWLSLERWKESESAELCESVLAGRACVGGLDLAEKLDLCAYVLAFAGEGGRLDFLCRFWLPEAQVEYQAKKGRAFLREWAAAGWITATPGEVVDHAFIRREINELRDAGFAPSEIAYDPHSATQIATQLGEEDGFTMIETSQGTFSLSESAKMMEAAIVERKARATGKPGGPNPVARWMVGNATKWTDAAGGIRPDRKRSKDKIDFISAAVTAMTRIVKGPEDAGGVSMYETEGMTAV